MLVFLVCSFVFGLISSIFIYVRGGGKKVPFEQIQAPSQQEKASLKEIIPRSKGQTLDDIYRIARKICSMRHGATTPVELIDGEYDAEFYPTASKFKVHLMSLLNNEKEYSLIPIYVSVLCLSHAYLKAFNDYVYVDHASVMIRCGQYEQSIRGGFLLPPSNNTFCSDCDWNNGSISQLFVNHMAHIIFFFSAMCIVVRSIILAGMSVKAYAPTTNEIIAKIGCAILIFSFHTWRDGDIFAGEGKGANTRKAMHDFFVLMFVGVTLLFWVVRAGRMSSSELSDFVFVGASALSGIVLFVICWTHGMYVDFVVNWIDGHFWFHLLTTIVCYCGIAVLKKFDEKCGAIGHITAVVGGINFGLTFVYLFSAGKPYNYGFIFEANALFSALF